MKLAEALMLRSDQEKKIASLRERIAANAVVQEGETPHEDPANLIKEAVGVLKDNEKLIAQINTANLAHTLPDGRTITEAIAARDRLAQHHALLHTAISGSQREPDRYSMSEIKWIATLEVGKLQKQADDLSKKIRELNAMIQQTNWNVEL